MKSRAAEIIKSECYVDGTTDMDRAVLINRALDEAVEALELRRGAKGGIRMNDIEKIQYDLNNIKYVLMNMWESKPMTSKYMKSSAEHQIDHIVSGWARDLEELEAESL